MSDRDCEGHIELEHAKIRAGTPKHVGKVGGDAQVQPMIHAHPDHQFGLSVTAMRRAKIVICQEITDRRPVILGKNVARAANRNKREFHLAMSS